MTGRLSVPPAKFETTDKAVLLHTFVKIAMRKNELTHTMKQIAKIAGLPIVR